jgi:hypothetical protein
VSLLSFPGQPRFYPDGTSQLKPQSPILISFYALAAIQVKKYRLTLYQFGRVPQFRLKNIALPSTNLAASMPQLKI